MSRLMIIKGNEAFSNASEEYGTDKISVEGDIIIRNNKTLGGKIKLLN